MRNKILSCTLLVTVFLCTTSLSYAQEAADTSPAILSGQTTDAVVNIELKDADIRDVLIALGKQVGANIVADPSLEGSITMHLENVPFETALDALVEPYGYAVVRDGMLYRIKKQDLAPISNIEMLVDGSLSLHVLGVPLPEVIKKIAQVSGASVILRPGIDGTVNIDLEGVEVIHALRLLAANFGYRLLEEDGVFVVAPPPPPPEPEPEPEPPAPEPPPQLVAVIDGFLTVDVTDMDIQELLQKIARESSLNIVAASDVSGEIDVYFDHIALEEGLETLLTTHGYTYRHSNDLYRVFKSPEEQGHPSFDVMYDSGNISVNVQDADLGFLLTEISEQSNTDIVIFGAVRDKVNIRITDVPLDQALDIILAGTRWSAQRKDDIILVGDRSPGSPTAGLLTTTRVIRLQHLKVEEVLDLLPASFPVSAIKILMEQNSLVVRGSRLELEELSQYIADIDQAPPVIMIDVLAVEYSDRSGYDQSLSAQVESEDGSNQIAMQPGRISGTLNVETFDELDETFDATLELLVSEGNATVKANPRIAALSGHEASINVGTEEYFRVTTGNVDTPLTQLEKISSGIQLVITPWSSEGSDRITVKIDAEVSSPGTVNSEGLPAISTRNASTELVVRNGETIVLGGLIESRESETEEGVPGLRKIPLLNWIFGTERESARKSELVFYITPRLATDDEAEIALPEITLAPMEIDE